MSNPHSPERPSGTRRHNEPTRLLHAPASQVSLVHDPLEAFLRRLEATRPVTIIGRVTPSAVRREMPFMAWPVRAGFPSPAEDDQDAAIDLNELLAPNTEATFLLRVRGESMTGAGIDDGDVLVVDRSLEATHGRVVVAVVDGEFTVKRLYRKGGRVGLEASHPDYPPIALREGQELSVWGVVTRIIKTL